MQSTIDSLKAEGADTSEITSIDFIEEVEPSQFELGVTLGNETSQTYRMNRVTLQALMAQIALYSI